MHGPLDLEHHLALARDVRHAQVQAREAPARLRQRVADFLAVPGPQLVAAEVDRRERAL